MFESKTFKAKQKTLKPSKFFTLKILGYTVMELVSLVVTFLNLPQEMKSSIYALLSITLSNGQAEMAVQTFKLGMEEQSAGTLQSNLSLCMYIAIFRHALNGLHILLLAKCNVRSYVCQIFIQPHNTLIHSSVYNFRKIHLLTQG